MMSPPTTHHRKMKEKGTTLIELMIYAALMGTVLMVLYQFFVQVNYQRINQFVQAHLYTNGRRVLFDFQQTVKAADSIDQPLMGQTSDTLNLDGGIIIYSVDSQGKLIKTEGAETNTLTDKEVTVENLAFAHLGPSTDSPTLQISFTLRGRHLTETGPRTESFQTAVTLR